VSAPACAAEAPAALADVGVGHRTFAERTPQVSVGEPSRGPALGLEPDPVGHLLVYRVRCLVRDTVPGFVEDALLGAVARTRRSASTEGDD
jgi:hypothetical protein